jgi:hypothetical protein
MNKEFMMKKLLVGLTLLVSLSSFASLNDTRSEFSAEIEAAATEIAPVVMACATIKTMPNVAFKGRSSQEVEKLQAWYSDTCINQDGSLNKLREDFNL